jgi:HEPN domain-containing protein
MAADAPRAADTRGWLRRAAADLRDADVDLAADPPLIGDAVFHCQQAAEKALKAFLAWHDVPFRKTHDLAEVGQQCKLRPVSRTESQKVAKVSAWRYPQMCITVPSLRSTTLVSSEQTHYRSITSRTLPSRSTSVNGIFRSGTPGSNPPWYAVISAPVSDI